MIIKSLEERMKKTIAYIKEEYTQIRAGRANPMILNRVSVDYYGTATPIKQLASISVPEPRIIQIQPYDASVLKEIERSILAANLGLNPTNDGKVIRLLIPMLTEERRTELTKDVKKLAEDAKVAIRNERRDAVEAAKKQEKDKEITEDELSKIEKEIQKKVDEYIKIVDELTEEKCKEIMEV